MRVGIVGWFGSDNLGDEMLLRSLITCVRAAEPQASFVVLCPDPQRVAQLHEVDSIHMPTLRGGPGTRERQSTAQKALRECDVLCIGPGTVFQERSHNLPWPGTLPLFARIVGMARAAGTPVAVTGAAVREGGTPLGKQLLRGIGAACTAVGVRDARSAGYFGRSARVIGDMAYTLPLPAVPPQPFHQPRFGVSMRPLADGVEGPLLAAIHGCGERLRADGWTGQFLSMAYGRGAQGENDTTIYEREFSRVMELAPSPLDTGGPLSASLDRWLVTLAGNQLVLGTRLHAALLAVALGVPTVAIAYERKVNDAFVDLGLERYVVQPDVDAATLYRVAAETAAARDEFQKAALRVADQGAVSRSFVESVLRGLKK
ncbi:polysaccharide pyruvyl transferase family protein [Dactylosporangium sp. NPDC051541]|uniref:polysaccharide pyruvyl transferase family protein n=1 Tax=Dactylosporangium sp. NPDC051541 TaxID=3363977 RepID=UPI0037BDB00B